MKILQRFDWGKQPCTANCSYVLVALADNPRDAFAVYLWNRDRDAYSEGYYFGPNGYTQALAELVRLVARYEDRYGQAYPGQWVFNSARREL